MGGKFRVKAVGGGRLQRRQFCAGTAAESRNRRAFLVAGDVAIGPKLFFAWQIGCDYRQ
jgi:hypothetical protein